MPIGGEAMAYTEAQKKATNKWIKNNYDRINITLPLGQREVWRSKADELGISLNEFIRSCVEKNL